MDIPTKTEFKLMIRMGALPMPPRTIQKLTGVPTGSVGVLLSRLVAKGLASKGKGPVGLGYRLTSRGLHLTAAFKGDNRVHR